MTTDTPPFQQDALDQLAQIIGQTHTGSEIVALFERSGFPTEMPDGMTKWRFVSSVFAQLQKRAGNRPHAVLRVIKTFCSPQRYMFNGEGQTAVLKDVNTVLEFYALRVRSDGELERIAQRATTVRPTKSPDELAFEARQFHPQVISHGRTHFARSAYFHAVFECCKAFDSAVRTNTGIERHGQQLMTEALGLSGPLKLNRQVTQSEKDEQEGVRFLCMGLMNAIRNPQAHEPELTWPMTREDALDVLALVSFLFRKLESAAIVRRDGSHGIIQL